MNRQDDVLIMADDDEVDAAELQFYANAHGFGGVSPLTQQRIKFRHTMRDAVVQKRGPVYFAISHWGDGRTEVVGPVSTKIAAARLAVGET